jgi:hypothetical protein
MTLPVFVCIRFVPFKTGTAIEGIVLRHSSTIYLSYTRARRPTSSKVAYRAVGSSHFPVLYGCRRVDSRALNPAHTAWPADRRSHRVCVQDVRIMSYHT